MNKKLMNMIQIINKQSRCAVQVNTEIDESFELGKGNNRSLTGYLLTAITFNAAP